MKGSNRSIKIKNRCLSHPRPLSYFWRGKSVVQVGIGIDLPTGQVLKIHFDCLVLQNMEKASCVLTENKKNLEAYLKLFNFVNGNNIKVRDLSHAVNSARRIYNLKQEKVQLEYDIGMLMDTKKYYETELDEIKSKHCRIR
jgi:hypothetical protein